MTHEPPHEHHDEDQKPPAFDPSSQPDRSWEPAVSGDQRVAPRSQVTHAAAGAGIPDGDAQADGDTHARAEALADRLEQLLERAPQCIESITQTLDGVDTLAASVVDTAEGSLRKVEATCKRAETLDEKLSEMADRLAGEGETTQQRIELLLNGLDAGDLLQNRVQECSEQLRTLADEAQKASSRQAEKLGSLVATSHERLTALDQSASEVVKVTIETIRRQVEDVVAESEKRLTEQRDRASSSSDELRVLQQTVERRLETLEESVCRKVGKLAGSQMQEFEQEVRKTVATQLDQVTGVIDKCASSGQALARDTVDAEHRLRQLEYTLTGISSVVGTAEEIAGSLKQQVADAAAAQETMRNLNTETRTAVQRGEESLTHRQREVTALLDKAVTVAEDIKEAENTAGRRTDELSNHLQSAAGLEEKLSQTVRAAGEALDATANQTAEMLTANSAAETLAAEHERCCAQATEAAAAAETAGQTLRQDADSIVRSTEDAVARRRGVLADAIGEAKHGTEDLQTRIDDADRRTGRLADAVMAAESRCSRLEELSATSDGLAARIERRCTDSAAAAEETFTAIKRDLTALAQDTNGVVSRRQQALAQVIGEAETCSRTIEGVLEPAKQAATQLSANVHAGTDLHDKLSLAADRASELLDTARAQADTLSAVNAEAERAAEAAEAGIDRFKHETGSLVKAGEEAAAGQRAALETVAREAQSLADVLDRGIETAERNCEQLSSRTHAAVEVESALCRITAVAHEIRDAIEHARQPLNERIARADALVGTLREACSQAEETQQGVRDLNADVGTLISDGEESMARQHDVLFAAIAEAKERTDDLRAGIAGSAQERKEIADEYHRAAATATQAAERIDALIKEVWSLATGTEQRTRELASEARKAGKLLEELGPTRTEAEALQRGIVQQTNSGCELVEQLKLQIGSGNETSGHLKAIQADSLRVVDRLASHCDNAEGIAKRISQVAAELQSDHDAIVANRTTLDELSEQGRSLHDMINRTQVATESVRVQVNSLLTEPQSVVCDAKQQAIQLTNVCRAVKKVFAGLSKTSLGATEKIDQLAKLYTDVTRATETLQQWVNEAAHVQQRLESTVEQAPAITQTHPPGRMYSLAEPRKQGGPAVADEPQAAPAETKPDRPTATAKRSAPADSGRRISAGAVAELIADAKRQHEREKKLVPSL